MLDLIRKIRIKFLIVLVTVFLQSQVLAGSMNWGTYADSLTLSCDISDCSGGGVFGGESVVGPTDNNAQEDLATSMAGSSLGTVDVTSTFTYDANGVGTFKFDGFATSSSNGIPLGSGEALAFYSYSGPTTTITITASLSANFIGPLSGQNNDLDGFLGRVLLFTNPDSIDSINTVENGARLTCLGDCYFADNALVVVLNTGVDIPTASLNLTLEDGDSFYLHATLDVGAAGGGSVETLDGFEVEFSSTNGLSSMPGSAASPDSDDDGIADNADNCTLIANPDQRDTNGDGYGNICDPDLNDDGFVNFLDIAMWVPFFNTASSGDEDFNGDNFANFLDFAVISSFFLGPPGPSGVAP